MAKKLKISSKKVPFLKSDLDLAPEVVAKLSAVQNKFKTRFKTQIEGAQKEATARVDQKIASLTKAKADKLKEFNAEIKKYQAMATDLKAMTKQNKTGTVIQKKTATNKTTTTKGATRKK